MSRRTAILPAGLRTWMAALSLFWGCNHTQPDIHYLGNADLKHYRDHATEIDYPVVCEPTPDQVSFSQEPQTLRTRERSEIRDITLAECIHTALMNNEIIRSSAQFLSPGNTLLTSPDRNPSIFDPAIQETGVLFGQRGVESALAAFDAQLTSSMVWGRNENIQNNLFGSGATPGSTFVAETAQFQTNLQKQFATGGLLQLSHNVNYLGNNLGPLVQAFPSVYTGNVQLQYLHPLLAGSGTEFTRIAGPIAQSFGGLTGVSQGVVIARINSDIVIADFENSVRNLVKDVEDTYWDLHLAYRNFDTAVVARNSTIGAWRTAETRWREGDRHRGEEAQARDQLFASRADAEAAQSAIYTAETRLRELLGMPVNDGARLRPSDDPVTAELVADWYISLAEALTHRAELRRQKWNIKSLELQLTAAKSLTRPRLDLIGGYQVNGFGDELLSYNKATSNFYESISQGNQTGWNLGVQMNMPIGFRSAHAQVRNYEFRIAKARKALQYQELEVGHELAVAFQELARTYAVVRSNFQRANAAAENVEVLEKRYAGGLDDVDTVLRAYIRRADADVAYHRSLIDYNKALVALQYRKGTLLSFDNVHLLEGGWEPDAYADAWRQAQARSHAIEVNHRDTQPAEFASPAAIGDVEFVTPQTLQMPAVPENPRDTSPAVPPAPEPADFLSPPAPQTMSLRRAVRHAID